MNGTRPNFAPASDDDLTSLIGSKRPPDRWETKYYDRLFCLYAGKVDLYHLSI
jgi:hypothetical protein